VLKQTRSWSRKAVRVRSSALFFGLFIWANSGSFLSSLVLYSDSSQIDLTLTTVYHSLSWGQEVRIPFTGERRTKGPP